MDQFHGIDLFPSLWPKEKFDIHYNLIKACCLFTCPPPVTPCARLFFVFTLGMFPMGYRTHLHRTRFYNLPCKFACKRRILPRDWTENRQCKRHNVPADMRSRDCWVYQQGEGVRTFFCDFWIFAKFLICLDGVLQIPLFKIWTAFTLCIEIMITLNPSRFKVEPHSKYWYFCVKVEIYFHYASRKTPCYFTLNGCAEKPREM